ncbi:hypothetical protein AVEN_243646-1 [Araneus ventricosus]|uniref:Uncharacterized protein n=1 Tax=Araneus ventricosus TaxID=182803 RepID=A0A4Y2A522_ARAVE|nr:hypothetical protein AVEN_243646-1 [Araneus ventricosus]
MQVSSDASNLWWSTNQVRNFLKQSIVVSSSKGKCTHIENLQEFKRVFEKLTLNRRVRPSASTTRTGMRSRWIRKQVLDHGLGYSTGGA